MLGKMWVEPSSSPTTEKYKSPPKHLVETSDHPTLKNLKSRGDFWALGQDQEKRFRFEIIREFVQKVRQVIDSTPETNPKSFLEIFYLL